MVTFDFESGYAFVGHISLPLSLTDTSGHVHLNPPEGPILRPITVSERLHHVQFALSTENSKAALAALILHQATVKDGSGNNIAYKAIALHLAGAGLQAPGLYECINLVAKHTGWSPESLFNSEASQIDHIAASLKPSSSMPWTRLLISCDTYNELNTLCDHLAQDLLSKASLPVDLSSTSLIKPDQSLKQPENTQVNHFEHSTKEQMTIFRKTLTKQNIDVTNMAETDDGQHGALSTNNTTAEKTAIKINANIQKEASGQRKQESDNFFSESNSKSIFKDTDHVLSTPDTDTSYSTSSNTSTRNNGSIIVNDQNKYDWSINNKPHDSDTINNALLFSHQIDHQVPQSCTLDSISDTLAYEWQLARQPDIDIQPRKKQSHQINHLFDNLSDNTESSDNDIFDFFKNKEEAMADKLAEQLDLEADLRGIN